MSANIYIIPPRIVDATMGMGLTEQQAKDNHLAIGLIRTGHVDHFIYLLENKGTKKFKQYLKNHPTQIPPDILRNHYHNHSDTYVMPHAVSTYLLQLIIDSYNQARETANTAGLNSFAKCIPPLIKAGANLFPLLFHANIPAKAIQEAFKLSPKGTPHDVDGYTLLHAHWGSKDFITEKLPILLNYGIDVNSVSTRIPCGTALHIMLANEAFDAAIAFVSIPRVSQRLNLLQRDGEEKTIAIIAAKTRGEDFLLSLGDHFLPDQLGINERDQNGCALMHYCMGLGLQKAALRYLKFSPDLTLEDKQGRSPIDYLDIPEQHIRNILHSIEIHPERDQNAKWNAILCSDDPTVLIHNNGPVLATKKNYNDPSVAQAALRQGGEPYLRYIMQQSHKLTGKPLITHIIESREALKSELRRQGYLPNTANGIRTKTWNANNKLG